MKRKIKRIIAILTMVILLFCSGCVWAQSPISQIDINNEDDFVKWVENNVDEEQKKRIYLVRFPEEKGWHISLFQIIVSNEQKKYRGVAFRGTKNELCFENKLDITVRIEDLKIVRHYEELLGELVRDIEIDFMQGQLYKDKREHKADIYRAYISNQEIIFYIDISGVEAEELAEAKIIDIVKEIVQSRYNPLDMKGEGV